MNANLPKRLATELVGWTGNGIGLPCNARLTNVSGSLTASVVKGMGAMPPKGGAASEAEVKVAVDYMISQSK
jgi:hypothetical protein